VAECRGAFIYLEHESRPWDKSRNLYLVITVIQMGLHGFCDCVTLDLILGRSKVQGAGS
jgi:hypothetical protein